MEHEKKHHHAEATKRVDERREERDRRNQATQQIEQVEDEIPHEKNRHQYRPDQCQQRSIFECHGRSITLPLSAATLAPALGLLASLKGDGHEGRIVEDSVWTSPLS